MKNKSLWIGLGILLAAVIFRVLCLDKTGGLWYDELVSYNEAAQADIIQVISYTLKTDVHFPVYPVLLHLWTKIFSLSDLSLRAFSAFFGVLTVIAAYFAGKELKSKETGLYCAAVFAINSFLIYYSQEVRLYSILMFLITLLTYFALRLKNVRGEVPASMLVITGFSLTSWSVVHTYTIAFLYVIPVFGVLYYEKYRQKENLMTLNYAASIFGILCLPALFYISSNYANYTNQINGYYCDWSSLFVVIQDWFSPVLEGLLNNPVHYISYLIHNFTFTIIFFIILPVIVSIAVTGYALKKDKDALLLIIPSVLFFIAEIIAFKTTNFKILPRYVSLALPNLLLVLGLGLSMLPKDKKLNIIIPALLIVINLSYLCFSQNAAFSLPRNGFRAVAELINSQNLNDGDFVVVWNRKEVLDKYVQTDNLMILSLLKDFAYRSERILGHEEELNKLSLDKRKKILRTYFAEVIPPRNNIALMSFILRKMKPGQRFVITSSRYFDEFSPEVFAAAVNNDEKYALISYNDLLTIKALIVVKEMCARNLNFKGRYENGDSVIFVFEK